MTGNKISDRYLDKWLKDRGLQFKREGQTDMPEWMRQTDMPEWMRQQIEREFGE